MTSTIAEKNVQTSFIARLSTGTGAFNLMGKRRYYYGIALAMVVIGILLISIRGFNFGIEFSGGTKLQFPTGDSVTTQQVAQVVAASTGATDPTVQTVGSGTAAVMQVRIETLSSDQIVTVKQAIASAFGLSTDQISNSDVSETWGGEISQRAFLALFVFLIAVSLFLWVRYERRVAVGAVTSVFHDLIVTAGIYSLVGFEVTPATVIGLLTILGFSLYDTVVVYDKVQENTKGLTSLIRRNFEEASNLAINQTLMRSINTTLIALLPVGGLLVAGVAILGSGTLKDLALVQLVGMIVSGYSSVFIAVPLAVDLKMRDPLIKAHTARVAARRKAEGLIVDADGDPIGRVAPPVAARAGAKFGSGKAAAGTTLIEQTITPEPVATEEVARGHAAGASVLNPKPGEAPKPGIKPQRPGNKNTRPAGKRSR